jgi:hypothetical protein
VSFVDDPGLDDDFAAGPSTVELLFGGDDESEADEV